MTWRDIPKPQQRRDRVPISSIEGTKEELVLTQRMNQSFVCFNLLFFFFGLTTAEEKRSDVALDSLGHLSTQENGIKLQLQFAVHMRRLPQDQIPIVSQEDTWEFEILI